MLGDKRDRVVELLGRGLKDQAIADRVGCSRTWVLGIRKDLGVAAQTRQGCSGESRRDRVEQLIARGREVDAIAREVGVTTDYVVRTRVAMDAAAAEAVT